MDILLGEIVNFINPKRINCMPEERRKIEAKIKQLFRELSLAQQCSLSEISRFGYSLSFVRRTSRGNLAVLQLDNANTITIDEEGEIDHHAQIALRSS